MRKRPIISFWIQIICIGVLIGIAAFWLSVIVATGNPDFDRYLTRDSATLLGLVVLSITANNAWKKILASDPTYGTKHKRFLLFACGWIVICALAAVAYGAHEGSCYVSIRGFETDAEHAGNIMQSIRKDRTEAGERSDITIADWISFLKAIEPRVLDVQTTVRRMRTTIPTCGTYRSTGVRFDRILANFDQRISLLKQEIDVAKSIESLPGAEQQKRWQSEYMPLIAQEVALEKEHN